MVAANSPPMSRRDVVAMLHAVRALGTTWVCSVRPRLPGSPVSLTGLCAQFCRIKASYFTIPCARKSVTSAALRPRIPTSTSSVC